MAVGQQAVQQGNYANAERIFLGGQPLTLAQDYDGQLNRLRHPV
jgi:hypothetical protein